MPLLLKSLELHGYKTFASRTLFEFADGITAIVGPNGSGKSNIADSLRWVLGEQSYSLLRAKKTEDMIFAGSETRTRAGMASVTVIFDNANGWLPVDFSEVALTRRAYRDGRNEYLLNGQQVRLREINELLAQSGLSERTYTILGQGLVDASLALKADERRRLFEEAAGVGLYRTRREETLRRLETTGRNLERVLDIIAELDPRLRSLERQARRAVEYSQMQADLRLLLRDWYGYHWHRTQKELTETREVARHQESTLKEARQSFQQCQQETASIREQVQALRARLNLWHRSSSDLQTQRETASRELAVLDERRRSLLSGRQALLDEQARLADERGLAEEKLVAAVTEVERLESEHSEASTQMTAAQSALQSRQAERLAVEEKLQQARQLVNNLQARRAEQNARLDELGSRLENLHQRIAGIEQALLSASRSVKQAEERHRAAAAASAQAAQELQALDVNLQAQRGQVADLESGRRQKLDERSLQHAGQSRLAAQFDVLEKAEQSLAGYGEGARFLLEAARQNRLKAERGALSTALDVPAEYETAIAAALGDHLDAVLLENGQDAELALQMLEGDAAGRAALLILEWLAAQPAPKIPSDPACLGLASSLVSAPDDLRRVVDILLGQVLVVRDRHAARRLVQGQPAHVRVVTLRGEVFRSDGSVLAGKAALSGTLGRPRQKRELQQALVDAGVHLAALDAELENMSAGLTSARGQQSRMEDRQRGLSQALDEKRAQERQASLDLESARRQHDWQQAQGSQFQAEASQAESDRSRLQQSQVEVDAQVTRAGEAVRQLTADLAALVLDEAQEQAAYWSTRLAVAARALEDARRRQSERSQALERLKEQVAGFQRRLEETGQALARLDAQKESLHQSETALNEQIAGLQVQVEPAEQELETAEGKEARQQEKEASTQRSLASAERTNAQAQMDLTRRQDALDSLRQRISDDFGLVAFAYETSIDGPVPLPLDGLVEQLPVLTELPPELDMQLTQQRAQLRRMGPVNPEAKQEYDSERDRFEFMTSQVADLRKAEADLHEVIAELDELTKQEFQKTFQAVDREFREIFVRLFGGGAARLSLTDPENLVETGIEIEARLPGRREQGLALLSGGERSLTAIALVFALLKVSPTPVCVMDEVDAMLDEANVGRFRDLLAELSRDTQFIIVTHNRNTVQAADVIYGITMGRDSASQMISLKLDEISDEMLGGRG